jgi:hypothetical protein
LITITLILKKLKKEGINFMAKSDKAERKAIDKVFVMLGAASAAMLIVIGSLAWYGYKFATNNVRSELKAQKIFFPAAGSKALDPAKFPGLQKYAGQQVDDGIKAKAYANEYIGQHLEDIAGGKTYAEISDEARKDPSNQKLQQQKQSLFQGETLRGILLAAGYSFWTFGIIAKYAAIAAFAGAAVMTVLVVLGLRHLGKLR